MIGADPTGPTDLPCPLGGDYWPAPTRAQREGTALYGVADTHTHLMTHLAFGGRGLWGTPDGAILQALASCRSMHGWRGLSVPGLWDGWGKHCRGYPSFRDWPTHDGLSHQHMYVEWLRRAWAGGLRLMVTFAVNNELLAWLVRGPGARDDASAIDAQVEATKAFASRHADFMEIAYSPKDARRIVRAGRLAVVLGVEVDSLVECGSATLSPAATRRWLAELQGRGVRHVFPIHLADNAVGGAAVYNPLFDVVTRWLRGRPFQVRPSPDVDFRIGASVALRLLAGRGLLPTSRKHGHVNGMGLTSFGREVAIPALMDLGIMIDVDHMSAAAVDDALAIAERRAYPLVASHSAFRALAFSKSETTNSLLLSNEYQRTPEQVARMRALGGVVGVGLNQTDLRAHTNGPIQVVNDLAGSSKTWAQAYLYAVDQLNGGPCALGSDANGLVGAPGPRFGPKAAAVLERDRKRRSLRPHQRSTQCDGVNYGAPTKIPVRAHTALSPCVAGTRVFDLNVDGMAHYGLLPDLLQDLHNVGVPVDALGPLFASAEGYVGAWERALAAGAAG